NGLRQPVTPVVARKEPALLHQAAQRQKNLEGPFGRAGPYPLEAEKRPRHGPTLVRFPKYAIGAHHDVVEEHFAEIGVPREVLDRPYGDSGKAHIDQNEADALLFRSRAAR